MKLSPTAGLIPRPLTRALRQPPHPVLPGALACVPRRAVAAARVRLASTQRADLAKPQCFREHVAFRSR